MSGRDFFFLKYKTKPQMQNCLYREQYWITRKFKGIRYKRKEKMVMESQGNLIKYIIQRED